MEETQATENEKELFLLCYQINNETECLASRKFMLLVTKSNWII